MGKTKLLPALLVFCVQFFLYCSIVRAEPPPDFPQFIVPGHEQEMSALRELFWLHYPRSGPGSTLWDQWMTRCSLWPGVDNKMRERWREALSNRRIDEEGYVASHQHRGLGHTDGWPFPMWPQGNGVGWHFTLKEMPFSWAVKKVSPDGFDRSGIEDKGVDEDGWHLDLKEAGAVLSFPAMHLDPEAATWIKLCCQPRGLASADPVLEWMSEGESEFREISSMHIALGADGKFEDAMIPVYRSNAWHRPITRLRIRFNNAPGASICIRYICSTWDSRHNVNNAAFILGCCNYFHWTGDVAFLRRNIQRMRLAMHFIAHDLEAQDYGYVRTPWLGHDGRTGLERDANGKAKVIIGRGIGNNYWDLLPFGGDDCLATIYAHAAIEQMNIIEREIAGFQLDMPRNLWRSGQSPSDIAKQIKKSSDHFWSESTGRFAACVDQDGKPHDYGYTFVNLEAISLGYANDQQAKNIMQWITGQRVVKGDTSTGADIYHFAFAPRASTRRNLDWYFWAWNAPESIPFGGQVQDGGAVFGFSYHDLDARLKVLGPDDAWNRLREIIAWFQEVQRSGGYREYYKDGQRGTLQGNGVPGGLGIDQEFVESALVPQVMLYGFAGFEPRADGFALHPRLPREFSELRITRIHWHEQMLELKIATDSVTITSDAKQASPIRVYIDGSENPVEVIVGEGKAAQLKRNL